MPAYNDGKNYNLGKGRLHFDQFAINTKVTREDERYLGNTPELSASSEAEVLDHMDGDIGLNIKDDSVTLAFLTSLAFTTDNISPENLAMWFAGDVNLYTVTEAADEVETHTARLGRFIQLGISATFPQGARNISDVSMTGIEPSPSGSPGSPAAITITGNYEVDAERGRIYIELDAPDITEEMILEITFTIDASERQVVISKGQEIRGALRFRTEMTRGQDKEYFYPYVKITSDGDYVLKGDEWQAISFNVEVLKLNNATELCYVDLIATA